MDIDNLAVFLPLLFLIWSDTVHRYETNHLSEWESGSSLIALSINIEIMYITYGEQVYVAAYCKCSISAYFRRHLCA